MKKKGLSQVISTVVIIALTISLMASAWMIIDSFVKEKLSSAGACYDILEKVTLNEAYTCYNATSNKMMLSISRKDFDLDSLLVSVTGETSSKTFFLSEKNTSISDVSYYDAAPSEVTIPGKGSGKTYCVDNINLRPIKIEIAPKREGTQCNIVDTIGTILTCSQVSC